MSKLFIPTTEEIEWIKEVAVARRQQAKQLGCRDRHDLKLKSEEDAMKMEIQGCVGEWGFAAMLGEKWQATVNSFKDADHVAINGVKWQIKTVDAPYKGLIISDDYCPDDFYALAHVINGDITCGVELIGWRKSSDVVKHGVRRSSPGRRNGFRVIPPQKLRPFPEEIKLVEGDYYLVAKPLGTCAEGTMLPYI